MLQIAFFTLLDATEKGIHIVQEHLRIDKRRIGELMLLQQKQSLDIVSHKNHEMPFALKLQMQKAFLNYCNQQDFFFLVPSK